MKPHRFDPLSFLLGAVLMVFSVTYLVATEGQIVSGSRLWPATIILVGLTLAAWGAVASFRRKDGAVREGAEPAASVEPLEETPEPPEDGFTS
ncbi:MAG: hypothetical protein ABI828_05195 [Actinomycetota bacterium]